MGKEPLHNVDAVAAVPRPSIVIDDEFTSMSRVALGCDQAPDPASVATSATRFLLVVHPLGDPDGVKGAKPLLKLEDLAGLAHPAQVVRHYWPLPIVEIETTADGAAEVAAIPEVGAVLPALGNIERARSFAVGLGALTRIAESQREMRPQALFGGIDIGEQTHYPKLVKEGDEFWLEDDPSTVWPAAPAIVPVINMSVGPTSATFPQVTNDLVNLATFGASMESLVVIAAGNCGELGMSSWATPEWVLAVGATDDAEGTVLADYSSRGPADGSSPGPDLVAWGKDTYGDMSPGTSFAAPRVSVHAMVTTAAFLQLGREVRLAQGEDPHGVSLVGVGFVDEFGSGIWGMAKRNELNMPPALPIVGVRADAAAELVSVTSKAGILIDPTTRPALVRECLLAAATPMPGYGRHEVGAGFLDATRMLSWLSAVTGLDLVRFFGPTELDLQAIDEATRRQLDGINVFDEAQLGLLAQVVRSTGPIYFYDWRTQRCAFAPCPSEHLDGLDLDERLNGFAVT